MVLLFAPSNLGHTLSLIINKNNTKMVYLDFNRLFIPFYYFITSIQCKFNPQFLLYKTSLRKQHFYTASLFLYLFQPLFSLSFYHKIDLITFIIGYVFIQTKFCVTCVGWEQTFVLNNKYVHLGIIFFTLKMLFQSLCSLLFKIFT